MYLCKINVITSIRYLDYMEKFYDAGTKLTCCLIQGLKPYPKTITQVIAKYIAMYMLASY